MKPLEQKKIITLVLSLTVILSIIYVNFDKSTSIKVLKVFKPDSSDNIEEKFLFCLIKTTPNALKSNKALTTYKIWGSRCSNYRFVTLIPNELLNKSVKYGEHREIAEPFYILQPEDLKIETRAKLTHKVYSAMRYVYSRFGDYEWYLIVDDDAYINMENMMEFLKNRNSSAPVTYGHAFRIKVKGGFHSGGCGYVLTGESFRRISDKLVSNRTFCQNTGFWDDVDLAACLRTLDVYINSSLDELGRERFLPVNFLSMYIGPVPKWLFSFSVRPPQLGPNCCSDSIVAIHYMKPQQQILLDAAFNMERYRINLFNNLTNSKLNVTFKNVVDHYFFLANQTLN